VASRTTAQFAKCMHNQR